MKQEDTTEEVQVEEGLEETPTSDEVDAEVKAEETVVESEEVEQKSDEDIEILKAKISGQKCRIDDLKSQLALKNEDSEKLDRLKHEFSNFKTRTFNDRKQAKVSGKIKTINEFLDVIDNLERAMKFTSETEEFKVGLEMINKSLIAKLEALGYDLEEKDDK